MATKEQKLPQGVKLLRTLEGHQDTVHSVAFDPQGGTLASGSADTTVKLWNTQSGKLVRTLEGHQSLVYCVAFDPQSGILASGSADHTVKLWDARSGKLLHTLEGHQNSVNSVAFDLQSGMLVSGSDDHTVKLWDARSGKLLRTLEGHEEGVWSVAFDPQGGTLASGSADNTVKLWKAQSGKLLRTLEYPFSVYGMAFHPQNGTLASGDGDYLVKIWEPRSGKLFRTLEGHTGAVYMVAFTQDGRLLASKSGDNTLGLWNCETWETVAVIPEPNTTSSWIPSLAFHPTLPLLATAGSAPDAPEDEPSPLIHLWELNHNVLLGQSHPRAVTYTSAKVVVVGESNVGKSYLAHRIATGEHPAEGTVKSTHGMKFWPLEPQQPSAAGKATSETAGLRSVYAGKLFHQRTAAVKDQRRDIVLWDMGGQKEYRLIHQLFLHDTTVALVLFDPTRGQTAFDEVKTWNNYLEKQLSGRPAIKLLVGAKLDQPSEMIDQQGLKGLREECGFAGYCETSALTGRGVAELCEALAKAIDWDGLGKTSRPELFQRIRDEIESRRKQGEVVLSVQDLVDTCGDPASAQGPDPGFSEVEAIEAVTGQLATQGVIARSRLSTGESVLVLQVPEIEHYAGSLILAARANQKDRGVPALELRSIAQENFHFPEIAEKERLAREQEKPVLDCTVQLMLEHGICFEHEGLLIFPSLFTPAPETVDAKLPHAVSLYYDFAGAIDNIYASLIAWLVLAKEFGKVRLWSDRAEFEVKDGGLCGLIKKGRPGGFAHVDVYFDAQTPERKQKEFISFVEDHLARNGVEIREHVAIKCPCGHKFAEETLRQRIARGDKDVVCPVCETRHSLTEGAAVTRGRDAKIAQHTWALRTQIEKLREKLTKHVVQVLAKAEEAKPATGPIRLLHLSDLHFTKDTPVPARLQWLLDDLKQDGGLGFKELDYLVISGDFTDKGCPEGFEKAYEFVSGLTQVFGLSAERCIFVPGNHDLRDLRETYDWRDKPAGLKDGEWLKQGEIILARNAEKYPLRLKAFSDSFFHKFLQRPYPLECAAQGITIPFWETGIQFLTLNSCWQIDQFHRKRSGVRVEAVANAINQAQTQEKEARKAGGPMAAGKPLLRIAVWHHAVIGPDQMKDIEFLGNLQKNGVRLALHGDVHEMQRELVGYRHKRDIHIVGSGSFGARAEDRPEAMPRLYNVLEIARDLKSVRVHTRCQPKADGPWDGWHEWSDPDGGKGRVPYYDIKW